MAPKRLNLKPVLTPDVGNLGVLIEKPGGYLYFHKDREGGIAVDESARLSREEPYLAVRTDSFPTPEDMNLLSRYESGRRRI